MEALRKELREGLSRLRAPSAGRARGRAAGQAGAEDIEDGQPQAREDSGSARTSGRRRTAATPGA